MANTATLQELKNRALDYADMTASDFPDEARLTDYVNSGLSTLHDVLVNTYDDYFRKTTNITLVNGQEEYDLPSDFYKVLQPYFISSDRRFKIERFNLHELDGFRQSPLGVGTVEFWYVPTYKKLEQPQETVDTVLAPGWEDYVALHAAIRLLTREESDPSALMAERDATLRRIVDMAEPRDIGTPLTIGDYYGRWNNAQHIFRFEERYIRYRVMGNKIHFIEFEYLGL